MLSAITINFKALFILLNIHIKISLFIMFSQVNKSSNIIVNSFIISFTIMAFTTNTYLLSSLDSTITYFNTADLSQPDCAICDCLHWYIILCNQNKQKIRN